MGCEESFWSIVQFFAEFFEKCNHFHKNIKRVIFLYFWFKVIQSSFSTFNNLNRAEFFRNLLCSIAPLHLLFNVIFALLALFRAERASAKISCMNESLRWSCIESESFSKMFSIKKLVKWQDDVTLILKNHKVLFNLVWCQKFCRFHNFLSNQILSFIEPVSMKSYV